MFPSGDCQICLGRMRLLDCALQHCRLRENGAFQGSPRFRQRRASRKHLRMFLLVALRKGRHRGLKLDDVSATIRNQIRAADTGDSEQRLDIFPGLFDLLELSFQAHPVRLGPR